MLRKMNSLSSFLLLLLFSIALPERLPAKDDELKPEDLIAQHLKSIGSPEAIAQITTRSIGGAAGFKFVSGSTGQMAGKGQWVSEKGKTGIVLRFGGNEYPGEHFAFDGKDAMVDTIKPGQRSPLGDFLFSQGAILKSELLGGVYSCGWPLLDAKSNGLKLKPKKKTVGDRELYEVEYQSKKSMGDVKVKLYFDPANLRHVMTEYRIRRLLGNTMTNYVMTEKFDDFRPVDNLTLPHKYSLDFLFDGGSGSLQTLYTFDAEKIGHNGKIDPQFYTAQR